MEEILPGIWHWTAEHPQIHVEVSSYWLSDAGVLIDPLVPSHEGLDRFEAVDAIVLANRHHYRQSDRFRERFGCSVHVPRAGLHEFGPDRQPVEPYDPGDELPGGLVVHEVGAICPGDMALHRPASRALWFADGLVHGNGGIGFVIDRLMDEPEETKQGLLRSFERILAEAEFDHLLFAHGNPVIGDAREQLEELVAIGGRTAWEA